FVNDVHAIAPLRRRYLDLINDGFADFFHLRVGSRVNLDEIHQSGVARDAEAEVARVARRGGGALLAIETLGEQARGGGFAGAARPAEEIGMSDAQRLAGERVAQSLRDVLLSHVILEGLRAIFAVERHRNAECGMRSAE